MNFKNCTIDFDYGFLIQFPKIYPNLNLEKMLIWQEVV